MVPGVPWFPTAMSIPSVHVQQRHVVTNVNINSSKLVKHFSGRLSSNRCSVVRFPLGSIVPEGPGQFTDLLWSLVPSHATVSSGSPTGNLFRRCLVRNHQHNNSLNGRRPISAVNPIVIHTYSDRGTLVRGPVFGLGSKLEIMILFYAYMGNQPRRS